MPFMATKPWSKDLPTGPWDYIVIGSGMGGMTAAAMLSKLGRRVLVLEQHYVPGGFTHTFNRPGYTWDVGVHAVGEVTHHTATGRLLTSLTDGRLEWASLGPVYDEFYYPGEFRIDFPDNPKQFRDNLVEAFPNESNAIDGYLNLAREVASGMRGYYLARTVAKRFAKPIDFMLARRTQHQLTQRTSEVVERLTSNRRLQTVLTSQWGYYGSPPRRSSFAIQALVTKHFLHGGYYPIGGSQQIALGLLETVRRTGGYTTIRADVDQIIIEGDRAAGVRLKSGETIRASRVISAAGIVSTAQRLLPPEVTTSSWVRAVADLPPAPAHVCLYLGFKGNIRDAGASGANKWFYEVWESDAEGWEVSLGTDELPDAPILYCSFPSLKDPTHAPGEEQRHTGEIVTFVPWSEFEAYRSKRWKKRGEDYDAFKKRMTAKLLAQFFRHMPDLEPMLDYAELSTPVSTEHFCRPVHGSIYGIEPTPSRFQNPHLRPRAPIRDLFFAGSEVATVGVMGAMVGGVLAVTSAEPTAALRYLRSI